MTSRLKELRILVVEDEALIAEEIRDRLEKLGAVVVGVADSASDAVVLADTRSPDIVLMDVRLKGARDGIDLSAEIYSRFNIPSVFLTAYSDNATIDRILSVGQFGYMTKPFRDQDLETTISIAWHHHKLETGLREAQLSLRAVFSNAADGLLAADTEARIRYANNTTENIVGQTLQAMQLQPIDDVLRLVDESSGETFAGWAQQVAGAAGLTIHDRELLLVRADGSRLPVALSAAPVRNESNAILGAAISLRDLTEKRAADEERVLNEKRLADQRLLLGSLIDGIPEMFFAVDRNLQLVVVNHALTNWLNSKRSDVLGRSVSDIFCTGSLADVDQQITASIRTGNRVTSQNRAWLDSEGELRWLSFSYFPQTAGGELALACIISEVTENKQVEDSLIAASGSERLQIGRDLHDTLGQELSSLFLLIGNLESKVASNLPDLAHDVAALRESAGMAIDSMRSIVRGLAPAELSRSGLPAALRSLAARCNNNLGIHCTFTESSVISPLAADVAEHIYRFTQECVANVVRHSGADNLAIELSQTADHLEVTVTDDGCGFEQQAVARKHSFGLRTMEYRAHTIGGIMLIEQPAQGTRVVLRVPLDVLRAFYVRERQPDNTDNEVKPLLWSTQ